MSSRRIEVSDEDVSRLSTGARDYTTFLDAAGFTSGVFITWYDPERAVTVFEEVGEGENPEPRLELQRAGRWAEFTAELRARRA